MTTKDAELQPVGLSIFTALVLLPFAAMCMWCAHYAFADAALPENVRLWRWIVGSQLSLWAAIDVWLILWQPSIKDNLRRSIAVGAFLAVGMNVNVLAVIWLLMPYASPELSVTCSLFSIGYVATTIIARPENSWVNRLCIGSTMISLAIVVARNPGEAGPYLLAFFFFYAIGMFILTDVARRSIQSNRAARLAADEARAEALTQRDAKARFLASASHDLGQPLQSAQLFFDQAVRTADPVMRTNAITEAKAAFSMMGRQLQMMIEHLQLESGKVEPKLVPMSAGAQISTVASLAEAEACLAGVEVIAVPSALRFVGDRNLIERALSNLAHNAIRHAKARRLLIGARRHGANVRFWVIDDGVGIAPVDLPRLFDDYIQGSDHGDEVRGGFGLGLASVRRMAVLMRGSAGVDTRWRPGAAFFLELPASRGLVSP